MARTLKFNTSDVFTNAVFTGNQLAILHLQNDLKLTQDEKQKIAKEFNYSETVFLHERPPDAPPATYIADIFTTDSEIPFAGHPTIGTASYIFKNLEPQRQEISIILKAGTVEAKFDRKTSRASAVIPHDFHKHTSGVSWNSVVTLQPGLASDEFKDTTMPIASIVKGVTFGLIDLSRQPDLLNNIIVVNQSTARHEDLDTPWHQGLIADLFYVHLPDSGDGIIRVQQRMIGIGIEDPATGAASAALSSYLALQDGRGGHKYIFELEQGVQMGRRSIIGCEVTLASDGKSIDTVVLSGQAKEVMKGELTIPEN